MKGAGPSTASSSSSRMGGGDTLDIYFETSARNNTHKCVELLILINRSVERLVIVNINVNEAQRVKSLHLDVQLLLKPQLSQVYLHLERLILNLQVHLASIYDHQEYGSRLHTETFGGGLRGSRKTARCCVRVSK